MIRFWSFILTAIICINFNFSIALAIENIEPDIKELPVTNLSSDENSEKVLHLSPKCEDSKFYEKSLTRIKDYFSSMTLTSTIAKRNRAILLANIDSFETINIKDITPQTDINTANALITLKINKHIKDADFVVCKQTGENKTPLYLIGHPEANGYIVYIINLDPYADNYEKISFTYP